MPAIINSAPDCINGNVPATTDEDLADFIVNAPYDPCKDAGGGIMTFGPGSTYGDGGHSAETAYYVLTWIGIAFMLVVIVGWIVYENRRLIAHAARISVARAHWFSTESGAAAEVPQPGTTPET